jgi:hypothetical protein
VCLGPLRVCRQEDDRAIAGVEKDLQILDLFLKQSTIKDDDDDERYADHPGSGQQAPTPIHLTRPPRPGPSLSPSDYEDGLRRVDTENIDDVMRMMKQSLHERRQSQEKPPPRARKAQATRSAAAPESEPAAGPESPSFLVTNTCGWSISEEEAPDPSPARRSEERDDRAGKAEDGPVRVRPSQAPGAVGAPPHAAQSSAVPAREPPEAEAPVVKPKRVAPPIPRVALLKPRAQRHKAGEAPGGQDGAGGKEKRHRRSSSCPVPGSVAEGEDGGKAQSLFRPENLDCIKRHEEAMAKLQEERRRLVMEEGKGRRCESPCSGIAQSHVSSPDGSDGTGLQGEASAEVHPRSPPLEVHPRLGEPESAPYGGLFLRPRWLQEVGASGHATFSPPLHEAHAPLRHFTGSDGDEGQLEAAMELSSGFGSERSGLSMEEEPTSGILGPRFSLRSRSTMLERQREWEESRSRKLAAARLLKEQSSLEVHPLTLVDILKCH